MNQQTPINNDWLFDKAWTDDLKTNLSAGIAVQLPHAMSEIPLHYGDETKLWMVSGYQKILKKQPEWTGNRIVIRFEGVMAYGELFVNGSLAGSHKGGYTPWELDITDCLTQEENLLALKVDSTERPDIPPFGAHIDYLCYNGIYRDVFLKICSPLSVQALMISQKDALSQPALTGFVRIRNTEKKTGEQSFAVTLKDQGKELCSQKISFNLTGASSQDISVSVPCPKDKITLWDIDNPHLYTVEVDFNGGLSSCSIGFREATFTVDGFFLNGSLLKLRGLNRHQSFPFVGYAMPARAQQKDAEILKYELGLNLVRTSHYPQSPYFLDHCDKIGLLVFEEIPGWQHIGDENWKDLSVTFVQEMIERDIHHPSIILWGVRINESDDDHDFYTKTNAKARQLDPTRQTAGVRCITHSEFLEDVYTMNDFILNGVHEPLRGQKEITGFPHYVPYMVTEYNGHMYPTKSFDQEERLIEHTKRHYQIISAAACHPHTSGSIGWCAFDYHTHFDFGSGDRICYHGVMDMFRIPKMAASAYKAQNTKEPFVQAVTIWARGERSEGYFLPLMISTNCDYVKVFFGDHDMGEFFPAEGRFPGLAHPPVVIDPRPILSNRPPIFQTEWGMNWENCSIHGYRNGKHVASQILMSAPTPSILKIKADTTTLTAPKTGEAWDTTRIAVIAEDKEGNRLPYFQSAIQIQTDGVDLIGDSIVSLEGGAYAFWVKASQSGNATVTVNNHIFGSQTIMLQVK